MGKITVTLSANAGLGIQIAGKRIWVDALHGQKASGFSTVTPQLMEKLLADPDFQEPDAICVTHCHRDHYSRELLLQAADRWPEAKLFLPEQKLPEQTLVSGVGADYQIGEVTLRFLRLPHEGDKYAHTVHYGLLILSPGGNILVSGDCATGSPALAEALGNTEIDVAIMAFPWLTLNKGRAFLERLQPKQLLLYHLPFPEDDDCGYRQAAAKAAEQWKQGSVTLLWHPLQSVTI